MEQFDYQSYLQSCELFDTLSDTELEQVASLCGHRDFEENETIYS